MTDSTPLIHPDRRRVPRRATGIRGLAVCATLILVSLAAAPARGADCLPDDDTACLLTGRFAVEVVWTTANASDDARVMSFAGARAESDQSAFFYFFDNDNFEMGVKMVDACSFNDSFWVFVSGLTNQAFVVNVLDTETDETRSYSNPLGTYPQTIGATDGVSGFDCTPEEAVRADEREPAEPTDSRPPTRGRAPDVGIFVPSAAADSPLPCLEDSDTACHLSGRFQVEVDWTTLSETGAARVMSFGGQRATSDQSSFWYFFDPDNFEMGVKMVDACSFTGSYWVFVSGLTNQGVTVSITDTTSGLTRPYSNPLGQYPRTIGATGAGDGFPCAP